MKFKTIPIILFTLHQFLVLKADDTSGDSGVATKSIQGGFGAVTIDGKLWNQIALRPVLPIRKFSVAFDIVLYIDQDGNIHDDNWDFSSAGKIKNTILDKIYYVRYGNRWGEKYFKIGALDNVTMGYGILLNNYSNTLLYPEVRKIGLEFKTKVFGMKLYGFTNDLKENMGLTGSRLSRSTKFGINMGMSFVSDRNQYLGLRDTDSDGRPDLVDDFPDNGDWWLDTDSDGWADNDTINEFDVDGDGLTDSSYTFPIWGIVIDTDGVETKPEPLNIKEKSESFNAFAIDFGKAVVKDGPVSVDIYGQYAILLGETKDPVSGQLKNAGYGIIPFGLSARFGPAKLNLEYRMVPEGMFEFGYFNRSYEVERATFQSISGNTGTIITKSQKLGLYGKQNGFYSSLNLDIGGLINASLAFQNLNGDQFNSDKRIFEAASNQSFSSVLKLKKPISKIQRASWFYQQRNVPNPFDFKYSESTIMGYNIGLELGNGMVLTYVFRRTFKDMNGDGDVLDIGETVNMTNIETSFSF